MKNLFLLLIVVPFIGVSIAQASTIKSGFYFNEGWNLVSGFVNPSNITDGEVTSENIKAIYILRQPDQEFVRVWPKPETEKLAGLDDDYYEKTANFVYSNKRGQATYTHEEPLPPSYWNEHKIHKGWNLIGLSKYMIESSPNNEDLRLSDITGNCEVESAYQLFDNKWIDFDMSEMDSTLLNGGLLLKVANNCTFGLSSNDYSIPVPILPPAPTLPNLLIVQTSGGLCQYGGCSSKITIKKDGTFTTEDGSGSKKSGNLGAGAVKILQNLIESSNYSILRKTPFTDECPTAYDGSEFTYKFQTSHGEEIIASCTTKIDSSNSLFQEVQKILNSIYSYN